MDDTAIVAFDPGPDLGLGAAGQDRTVAIDQMVVSAASFFWRLTKASGA